jgi:hypothetical protein
VPRVAGEAGFGASAAASPAHLPALAGARPRCEPPARPAEPSINVQTPPRTSCAHIPTSRRRRACLGGTSSAHSGAAVRRPRRAVASRSLAKRERSLGQSCARGAPPEPLLLLLTESQVCASPWTRQAEPVGRAVWPRSPPSAPHGWGLRARRQRHNAAPSANMAVARRGSHEIACRDGTKRRDTMR